MTVQRISHYLLPLFFLTLPFAFPFQVITQNPLPGGFPYIFLLLHIFLFVFENHRQLRIMPWKINATDWLVMSLVASFSLHLIINFLGQEIPYDQMVRIFIVYVVSAWVYVYISRFATEEEIRIILTVAVIASIIIALHWMYETYTKLVLQQISWYQHKMYDYFKFRNNFSDGDVNVSLLGPEYRAYGLLDKHTTTGAFIVLGAFSALALLWNASFSKKFFVMFLYFVVLSIGMATTAWIGFVVLVPIALLFSEKREFLSKALSLAMHTILCTALVIWALLLNDKTRKIFEQAWYILRTQFSYVINVDGTHAPISFVQIYSGEIKLYLQYISHHPLVGIIGEGFWGHNGNIYPRGGDVAFIELVAILGIPLIGYLLFMLLFFVKKLYSAYKNPNVSTQEMGYFNYGILILLFLSITLAHYNSFTNKTIFIFLYLGLALIGRYFHCASTPVEKESTYVG
jgi:hypothetical protein